MEKPPTKRPKPVAFMLRLPPELHDWLKMQADMELRSLNAQILSILKAHVLGKERHD